MPPFDLSRTTECQPSTIGYRATVTGPALRPLLFLDVDGPLLPFGATPTDAALRELGSLLAALPCDLVWATTWDHTANEVIAPRLGIAPLPVVDWLETDAQDDWFGLHWKTRSVVAWADRRAFAWIDDEVTDRDREWITANHPGHALLHAVDAHSGLTGEDVASVRYWLRLIRVSAGGAI